MPGIRVLRGAGLPGPPAPSPKAGPALRCVRRAVARVGGADAGRLLAPHEVAAETREDKPGGASAPQAPGTVVAGPEVAEVRYLTHRAGTVPGEVGGVHGPLTQRAVERSQKRADPVVDGIVGPHTWKALRGAARD